MQVALYADADDDGVIDDHNGDGAVTLADVDNYPLGNFPAEEDVDHNANGQLDQGDALQVTHTDSWDDNLPTGCPGKVGTQNPFYIYGNPAIHARDCFDGLRTYNQVRNGVFDGGYAFNDIPAGRYIVQAAVPPGYVLVKEEDRNVDFGTTFEPAPQLLPPVCVGDLHRVRAELVLFPGVASPFAREMRPLCDRKKVVLNDGTNAAVDFFMYTLVPKAARGVGFVLDDLGNEFDANSPAFGEKYGPPWLPIAVRDYTGVEISRVYTDEWGNYNFLVPSTFSANLPTTSGISPNMLRVCINDPGPIPDPANPGRVIQDPGYLPQYTRFCYTFNFMPGTTTFLDTPIIPTAAYTGFSDYPLDCEFGDGTPVIYSVSSAEGGPWLHTDAVNRQITIVAQGPTTVPNPEYDQALGTPRTIVRDFGFGSVEGQVKIGNQVVPPANVQWGPGQIVIDVPAGFNSGQLTVTRGDNGRSTEVGVTLHITNRAPIRVAPGGSIQAAIDAARAGDLILVSPGAYEERVVIYKAVKLQGWGAGSTFIQNTTDPQGALDRWRDLVQRLFDRGRVALAQGQPGGTALLRTEESGAITVLAPATGLKNVRIDGFTLTSSGGDTGGGVFVNGYTDGLTISNNRIVSNRGIFGGGIRFGHMALETTPEARTTNTNVKIRHNQVMYNGTGFGAGGGIALYAGTHNYAVTNNFVCGNFSAAEGGGIGHLGRSENGLIANNRILFNESFNQLNTVNGGGVFVGGLVPFGEGSGSVTIAANVIQGNQAGGGDGGGIRAQYVDGPNVTTTPDILRIENNVITNNVAGMAGGGISLQDATHTEIIHNTVAHNDSTATAGVAFVSPGASAPRPAGIVSHSHSSALAAALGAGDPGYSNPVLGNNIVWRNRSFWYDAEANGLLPDVEGGADEIVADLAVIGVSAMLAPQNCLLTDVTGYEGAGNVSADPQFVNGYFNGRRNFSVSQGEFTTNLGVAIAFDEGGNFIDVSFGPLTPIGDYHILPGSPARDAGSEAFRVPRDVDDERRLPARPLDLGADEIR
ncbi:MAG: hypothetical protein AB7U81_06870 [Thiohalomonadaceae bacterium]